jgi:protein SCO1
MISRMSQRRSAISTLGFLALLASIAAVGCGSSGSSAGSSNAADTSTVSGKFAGTTANPAKPAPPLALKDSLGQQVNINNYRGKAVLVTFIYDHCPDVCPIIVGNLHTAQSKLGPEATKLQIIAVSVDPKGDTPKTVKAFLKDHQMTGRMQYLIGSRPQLEHVWSDWNIVAKSSPKKNNPDLVEHSALIYGISGSGKITTLYPANFKPAQIVHDVPKLAAS